MNLYTTINLYVTINSYYTNTTNNNTTTILLDKVNIKEITTLTIFTTI